MKAGVKTRVGVWLILVAALVTISGFVLLRTTQARLEESAIDSLEQLVDLERDRLIGEVDDERAAIDTLARDQGLIANYFGIGRVGNTNFDLEALLESTQLAGQDYRGFRLIDRSGNTIDQTAEFDWEPLATAEVAMEDRSIEIGLASPDGMFGFVAPVVSPEGEVLGALVVETDIRRLVWLSSRYESFSETSEAFVYQISADGSCQVLTNLRFDRSAEFSPLAGEFSSDCADLDGDRIVSGNDYRGVSTLSAWTSVPESNWGVVVKMDDSDVFGILRPIQQTILASGFVAALMLLGGWFSLVRPIGTRLSRTAVAAEQLASGNYNALIGEDRSDEIGRMSQSMDRLAKDLAKDIERRENAEAQLRVRADFDELTGLMNRHLMNRRMHELSEAGHDFSVVFMDLDGFKQINDTHGHSIGDQVLQLVSTRASSALEAAEIEGELGRWGGDEFVILCPGKLERELRDFLGHLSSYFDSPFRTEAGRHRVGISIGIADTSIGDNPEAIMSAADESMYQMKRTRDGRTRVSPQAIKLVEEALDSDRVMAFLQPLISIDGESQVHLFGAEALVRIRNEDGSFENPGSFLPGLGSSSLATSLDLRVLEKAATTAAQWHREGLVPKDFYISTNFGAAAMADTRLPQKIRGVLDRSGLNPQHLVVEIPETARDVDPGLIRQMRQTGILIAIDDVGCQYSNLGRLVDIPADIAKIDRRWLPNNDPDQSSKIDLLRGLIQQCEMLDLAIIVEGIETPEQLELVGGLGVERFQGFLFGRPEEETQFERLWGRPGSKSLRASQEDPKQANPDETGSVVDVRS